MSLLDRRWAVQFGDSVRATLPVSSILLGFLFAGFWWTLNRELTFKAEERHFKLGIGLQLIGMVMLAVFGVVLPMRGIAYSNRGFLLDYRGVGFSVDRDLRIYVDRPRPLRRLQVAKIHYSI